MVLFETSLIIKTIIIIMGISLICVFNVYHFVRNTNFSKHYFLHICSGMTVVGLFCLLLDAAIMMFDYDIIFFWIGIGFIIAALLSFACYLTYSKLRNLITFTALFYPPDLHAVFDEMEDLIMIFDYKGNLLQINNLEHYDSIFRIEINSLSQLNENLKANSNNSEDDILANPTSVNRAQIAIELRDSNKNYLLTVAPIIIEYEYMGCYVILHNITDIKQSEELLRRQIIYLEKANNKLSAKVRSQAALDEENARLRFLKQIQQVLFIKINNINDKVQETLYTDFSTIQEYQNVVLEISDQLRDVYTEVRNSIRKMSFDPEEMSDDKSLIS